MTKLTRQNIVDALNSSWPGAQWTLNGDDLTGLVWNDTSVPRPTDDEISAAAASVPITVAIVSPRQARLALLSAGLLEQAEAAIRSGSKADQISWDYATEFRRDDPLLVSIGSALNLTSDQIDVLFKYAATL